MITIFTVLSAEEKKSEVGKLIAGTDGYICNEVYRALPQYVGRQWRNRNP